MKVLFQLIGIMLLLHPVWGQVPTIREAEAENYLQEIYKYLGSPGGEELERRLGMDNTRMIYQGIIDGHWTSEEANTLLVEILLERGTLPVGSFLPDFIVKGIQAQPKITSLPMTISTEPFVETPQKRTETPYQNTNPLIRVPETPVTEIPQVQMPPANSNTITQPSTSPGGTQSQRTLPARVYTDEDFEKFIGPIGIYTNGGSRGQRPQEIFSGEQLMAGVRGILSNRGTLPQNNRTNPGIAAIQILLLAAEIDLGEELLDGFAGIDRRTETTLKVFQQREGLPPNGLLTRETWESLLRRAFRPR